MNETPSIDAITLYGRRFRRPQDKAYAGRRSRSVKSDVSRALWGEQDTGELPETDRVFDKSPNKTIPADAVIDPGECYLVLVSCKTPKTPQSNPRVGIYDAGVSDPNDLSALQDVYFALSAPDQSLGDVSAIWRSWQLRNATRRLLPNDLTIDAVMAERAWEETEGLVAWGGITADAEMESLVNATMETEGEASLHADAGNLLSETMSPAILWTSVRDGTTSTQERVDALCELLESDPENAARFVVDSVCDNNISEQWQNSLIFVAEMIQLDDDRLRERLASRLYDLASDLRHRSETGIKPVVQSAIRCYSSLIPESLIDTLRIFLEPPNPVETRLVTLQCIVHLFETKPPVSLEIHQQLADRVYELAKKFMDRDWLVAGEKAAIGQNATVALAALGDTRLGDCVETVRQLEMKWLTRQIDRKLNSLLRSWTAEPDASKHPAVRLIQEQLAILSRQDVAR